MILKRIISFIAQLSDKIFCYDITENKERTLKEFEDLLTITEPWKFKHEFQKFQMESDIRNRFATEKSSRLMGVMTFTIMILTIVIMTLTAVLLIKQ